ncbi:lipoprotein-releasing ABC transporter permease subunit [Desulfothermus okinawensis JCM 13304]
MSSFELFVATKYLLSRRKHSFISVISVFSIAGIGLGVAALIVVLGVMNGFSNNLQQKILGVNAHIIITSIQGPIGKYKGLCQKIKGISGVKGAMPFLYSEVMVSSQNGVKGVVLRGIDPQSARDVLNLNKDLVLGSVDDLSDSSVPPVIIGKELAFKLGLGIGSFLNVLSPTGGTSSFGFMPKIKVFKVVGIFDTGMYEYDSSLIYTNISSAQKLIGFKKDVVTGIEVSLYDVYKARDIASSLNKTLGHKFFIQTWMDMNKNLFSALKLEKFAMGVILVMIVLVGSFSIITTLFMLVMEKKKDIAILISMGATKGEIKRIFVWLGSLIGLVGTSVGYCFGLGIGYLIEKYQFIKLPKDVYYLDHLPVEYSPLDLVTIGVVAMLLCFLATLYPASQASKVEPAQVLRYE